MMRPHPLGNDVLPSMAAAAIRPDRMQPPRTCLPAPATHGPAPPKPAASPTAYRPSIGRPAASSTRLCKSVTMPPSRGSSANDEFAHRDQRQCLLIDDRLKLAQPDTVAAIQSQRAMRRSCSSFIRLGPRAMVASYCATASATRSSCTARSPEARSSSRPVLPASPQ